MKTLLPTARISPADLKRLQAHLRRTLGCIKRAGPFGRRCQVLAVANDKASVILPKDCLDCGLIGFLTRRSATDFVLNGRTPLMVPPFTRWRKATKLLRHPSFFGGRNGGLHDANRRQR